MALKSSGFRPGLALNLNSAVSTGPLLSACAWQAQGLLQQRPRPLSPAPPPGLLPQEAVGKLTPELVGRKVGVGASRPSAHPFVCCHSTGPGLLRTQASKDTIAV